jgi:uncharacterized protein YbjT (DUF2867 family)
MPTAKGILITGASGYLGSPLSSRLLERGHRVRAFVRPGSEKRAAAGVPVVVGDPFSVDDLTMSLRGDDTLVHLLGTPRPSPRKAQQFLDVDLASIRAATLAARRVGIAHIVYVSVAHPAPIMQTYIDARTQGEALVRETGIPATILRPWYVLGPGHWWPYALVPVYWVFERIPSKRAAALRLGLVTREQMIAALVTAVERGPDGAGILEVKDIRSARVGG